MNRVLKASLTIALALLVCLPTVAVPSAYAHLELPKEEQEKLYPKFPEHAVGTTDAAKKLEAQKPKGLVIPEVSREVTSNVFEVSLSELEGASARYDEKLVQFEAEAVGDIIEGPKGYKWVLFDDGTGSISCLVPDDYTRYITSLGRYGIQGSVLRVTGVYKVSDDDQAGEMDVRVYKAELLDSGEAIQEPFEPSRLYAGLGFVLLALLLLAFYKTVSKKAGS